MLKSMKKKLNETKGFTLIEVIVVLVIIAILMAIAVPNVLAYINRAKGTEAQAQARSIYMAATAESAEILKTEDKWDSTDLGSNTDDDSHLAKIAELANFKLADLSATDGTSTTAPTDEGKAVIYVNGNVVAGVVYYPVGADKDKDIVVYVGSSGDILVGNGSVDLEAGEPSSSSAG